MSTPTVEELVAYVLFDADPRIDRAQRPVHGFLVSLALFRASAGLTREELYASVVELLPTDGAAVVGNEIAVAVEAHIGDGLVREADGRLYLSDARRAELEEARSRVVRKREAFHGHLVKSVEDKGIPLSSEDREHLRDLMERHLVDLLQAQSATIAAAWTNGVGFDEGFPELNARAHAKEIANEMGRGAAALSKLRRVVIANGLEAAMRELPREAEAYLATLYQRTVAMALLAQDPSLRHVRTELAKERVVYLDANVVIAAMFSGDERHTVAQEALELTRALGATVRITQFSVDEVAARLAEAARFMRKYRGPDGYREIVDDFAVRSFQRAARDTPSLEWSAFIAGYEPPQAWLREHDIEIEEKPELNRSDKDVVVVRTWLAKRRPKASLNALDTDALNVVHIARQRKTLGPDEMGSRVWLMTLDRALAGVARDSGELGEIFPPRVAHRASTWIELLTPCLPPDEERLAGYVTHLVRSQFSLLGEDPAFVHKEFLLTLQQRRIDIDVVLNANPERARQILIRLQLDEEIEELFSEPRPDDDGWNEKVGKAIQKALREADNSPTRIARVERAERARFESDARAEAERKARLGVDRELMGRTSELRRVEEAALATRAERDALARRLDEWRSLPWWRRVFRRP